MGVDGCKEAGTDAMVVVLVVRYVFTCARVTELLCEAKVDDVDDVVCTARVGTFWDDKVGRLDVSVNEIP